MTFGAPYPIDADAIAEWNAGIKRARDAYNPEPVDPPSCSHGVCSDTVTCTPCRRRAEGLLQVATSVDECAELLNLLDRPTPERGRPNGSPCGTESARRRHRAAGEPCPVCWTGPARDRATCETCGEPIARRGSGGLPMRFCGRTCRNEARRKHRRDVARKARAA